MQWPWIWYWIISGSVLCGNDILFLTRFLNHDPQKLLCLGKYFPCKACIGLKSAGHYRFYAAWIFADDALMNWQGGLLKLSEPENLWYWFCLQIYDDVITSLKIQQKDRFLDNVGLKRGQ